ncbi:MAG: aminotransferase class I/II-fold pyridoxal phosphate-dependent enzyme [Actinobacteria bacterium]|nr:aminotransferase class I/II-fold pyridoxal phosphate-dependent enzyme [Actinomycetota bacterium]
MTDTPLSGHIQASHAAFGPFMDFLATSRWTSRAGSPGICDFAAGNPQDMALPAYVEAIREASIPRSPDWFAYKGNEGPAREAAAASLRQRLGIDFESDDVFLTKGASTALAIAMATLVRPGDEVIFSSPPWFFYESMIAFSHGVPVRVKVDLSSFDLDVDAIGAAITPRTRAVIVNSPNNPTGRIYPPPTLERLAQVLTSASEANGRPIYLLSDEAYNRILFEGAHFTSPTSYYRHSMLLYSYGKTLLAPGQRLGYLALPPSMPGREEMRKALLVSQFSGYGVPDAVLQHALPAIEPLCIDLARLQRRRDVMVEALRECGYEVHVPEGTFYLLPRCPIPDDAAFTERLAADDVFVLPGHIVELPGYFRISLTASDEMVERSLPRFAAAIEAVR